MHSDQMGKLLRFDRSRKQIPEPDGRLAFQPADADDGISRAFVLRLTMATIAAFAIFLLLLRSA
jgi:hypothetical protein